MRRNDPILGELMLFLSDDPQRVKAWRTGASGEVLMGRKLNALADKGVVVLHDRRVPGSRANLDHVVVAPSGIYVIDTKTQPGTSGCPRGAGFCDARS